MSLKLVKKVIIFTAMSLVACAIFAIPASKVLAAGADDACTGAAAGSPYCQSLSDTSDPVKNTIKNVTDVITFAGGFIAVLWIIFSGIKFATSSGDPQKAASARNGIIYASVGLVIMVSAQALILFALSRINK